MLSISTTLSNVISHDVIFYWPAAEPLEMLVEPLGSAESRLKITALALYSNERLLELYIISVHMQQKIMAVLIIFLLILQTSHSVPQYTSIKLLKYTTILQYCFHSSYKIILFFKHAT